MKRCPQCLFLYPDSDEHCDFDKTLLEVVDDAEIEAATRPPRPKRTLLPIVAAVGLLLGVFVFALVYYAVSRQTQEAAAAPQTSTTPVPVATPQPALPSPSPAISPSPSPTPSPKT